MQMLVLSEKVPRGMEGVTFDKILKYAMAFESEFDKIHVITSHDYSARASVSEKLNFHRASWRETSGFLGIFTHILYLTNVFCTGSKILRKEKDITIVTNSWGHYTLGPLAVMLAKLAHRKGVVRVAGSPDVGAITAERRYGLSINPILLMLEKAAFKHSDLIISVSESIFERHPWIRKKTFIISDLFPVVEEFAEDTGCSEKGSSKTGEIKILYIGRLEPEKGVDILIESLNSTQFNCTIVGDGSLRKELEGQAEALGIADRVTFTGYLPQKEAHNLICVSDILVLPSYTEFTPNVIIEAMAIGTTVVASNVGGIKYIIKDGENGFTFEKGSIEGLTEALTKVVNDPELRRKVCEIAKKQVCEKFSYNKIKSKAHQAITKLH